MSHADIICAYGDRGTRCATALTQETGERVDPEAVYKWREHNRIPAPYWSAFVASAKRLNIPGVTLEALAANAPIRQRPAA